MEWRGVKGIKVEGEMNFVFRKPILGKILSILQIAMGVCCLAVSVYLLYLMRTPEILKDQESAEIIRGLQIAAGIVVLPGVFFSVAGGAMLCRCKWGWWLGLLVCMAAVATLAISAWDDRRHPDVEDLWVLAGFVVATIFFFLPGVRNYLVANNAVANQASSTETI
jgi:hypothetical protein